jgi:hypothetical protein
MKGWERSSSAVSLFRGSFSSMHCTQELYLTLSKRNRSVPDPYIFGPPGSRSFPFLLKVLSGLKYVIVAKNIIFVLKINLQTYFTILQLLNFNY